MKKIALIVLFCFVGMVTTADIPAEVAYKSYTPAFVDWVLVFFKARYSTDQDEFFISIRDEWINNKARFIFTLGYANTVRGRRIRDETFPSIKQTVKGECEHGTSEGYPISLNDISFQERPF